ncbi:MAG: YceD family protein [Gammaproteobacteria bacterium]|nr:YceD family protein [Gammaproteobacteria bacterium]
MFDQWQRPLDIRALIRQGITLEGEVSVAAMPRLQGMILRDAPICFSLSFGKNDEGLAVVSGEVEGRVEMTCQRCLKAVAIELNAKVQLGVVESEDGVKRLPPELDPLILGEGVIRLADLIEDEVLLALPAVPMHAYVCAPAYREHEGIRRAENPFASLRGLVKPPAH